MTLTKNQLIKYMQADQQFTDIDINDEAIGFHIDHDEYFHEYMGFDVIWNECEDGEGQVNL